MAFFIRFDISTFITENISKGFALVNNHQFVFFLWRTTTTHSLLMIPRLHYCTQLTKSTRRTIICFPQFASLLWTIHKHSLLMIRVVHHGITSDEELFKHRLGYYTLEDKAFISLLISRKTRTNGHFILYHWSGHLRPENGCIYSRYAFAQGNSLEIE